MGSESVPLLGTGAGAGIGNALDPYGGHDRFGMGRDSGLHFKAAPAISDGELPRRGSDIAFTLSMFGVFTIGSFLSYAVDSFAWGMEPQT